MRTPNGSVPDQRRSREDAFHLESLEREGRACYINQRVDGADLVKVNRLDRDSVNTRLGFGDSLEDAGGQLVRALGEVRSLQ